MIPVTVSAGSDGFSLNLVPDMGMRRVQVSTNEHFPAPFTREADFDTEDTTTGDTVRGEEVFHMLEDTGLGLIACGEEEDVLVTLRGDGVELNRYFVDIGPAPVATATPAPDEPPNFGAEYTTRRFCADAASDRADVLDGGETVGRVSATGASSYELVEDSHGLDHAFFVISSGSGGGDITVSQAGADDHAGMDGDRLYSFIVRAEDSDGLTSDLHVSVLLDRTNLAINGDGICP